MDPFRAIAVAVILILCLFCASDARADQALCPPFRLRSSVAPEFSPAEKQMICGYDVSQGSPLRAWATIPQPQAIQAMRSLLQQRGYNEPVIQESGGVVWVEPGEKTRVHSVEVDDAPEDFDVSSKRGVRGEFLTPGLLDELENWSLERLQNLGYPCPEISTVAGIAEQTILLRLDAGEPRTIGPVISRGVDDPLRTELTRFYAFQSDWNYRRRAVELTSSRLVREGLVESAQFVPVCTDEAVGIIQDIVPGEPRLFSIQLALDTEEAVRVNARLVHREDLRKQLLLIETSLLASLRIQQLSSSARWYAWPAPSRRTLEPRLLFQRMDEDPFELTTEQLHFLLGGGGDVEPGITWNWRFGPAYSLHQVQRGPGPESAEALSMQLELSISSHESLFYRMEAQQGWSVDFLSSLSEEGVFSDYTARRVILRGESNIPIGHLDPALVQLGLRAQVGTTSVDDETTDSADIPPDLRHYLGGMDDLRGFTRRSIPFGRELGGLTKAFVSLEARPGLLNQAWTPLVFVDVGAIGKRAYSLERPVYWSPGVGLKWNSPVGPIRGTLANGRIDSPGEEIEIQSRWQIFLSWGETF